MFQLRFFPEYEMSCQSEIGAIMPPLVLVIKPLLVIFHCLETSDLIPRGPPFSLEWGVMNFRKYLGNIFVTPYLMIKNFMSPSGATMLKKHVTHNARSVENMHFGGYFIEQNFH